MCFDYVKRRGGVAATYEQCLGLKAIEAMFAGDLISSRFEKTFLLRVPIAEVNDAEIPLCLNRILAEKNTGSYMLSYFKDVPIQPVNIAEQKQSFKVAYTCIGVLPFNDVTLNIVEQVANRTLGYPHGSALFEKILNRLDYDFGEQNIMETFVKDMIQGMDDEPAAARRFALEVAQEINKIRFRM